MNSWGFVFWGLFFIFYKELWAKLFIVASFEVAVVVLSLPNLLSMRILDLDFDLDLELVLNLNSIESDLTSRGYMCLVFFKIFWDFSIILSMLSIDILSS